MMFSSSTQTIAWLQDRYREGNLVIKPPYQRKPVWVARQKCYLIESILEELPVPEIYIQQSTTADGKTTYAIVDGQQRVRTVLQFIGAELDPEEQEYNKFTLDKLLASSRWRNKAFTDLTTDDKKRFYGYKFSVRYLETDSDDEIRDMFRRLNKYLTPLKPQELRNATYSGPFVDAVLQLAESEYWAENRIVTPALIRRMGDVEFVSELLVGVLHGPQGGSAAIIDEYYEQYEDFEDEFPDQRRTLALFRETLDCIRKLLPNIKDSRWGNKTDFYTLFVGIASLLRTHALPGSALSEVRTALNDFATEVDRRLSSEHAKVSKNAIGYVRAVEKGANDKIRRANRHAALLEVLKPHLRKKGST
jgi:hypothetical protein